MLDLDQLLQQSIQEIEAANDLSALEQCRITYLGKKGLLTEFLKSVGHLPPEERPLLGQKVNVIKRDIHARIEQKKQWLEEQHIHHQLASEAIDITLPGRKQSLGSLHPITQTCARIESFFSQFGFTSMSGPEREDDFHNFEALNIPRFHPARAMQDTFYLTDGHLLRTQMSPVQIRYMKSTQPPLRMIAMGRVYRRDFDLTHTPMFHQLEGLMVDECVTFADLKGMLTQFLHAFFEKELPIRFRPSYFPFTEPSAEVDMGCVHCQGKGCRICKHTGWLEVLGCGMVHPNVFQSVDVDSERFTGWAFGAGIDRLCMLYYGITDLRTLFENDVRFLRQF